MAVAMMSMDRSRAPVHAPDPGARGAPTGQRGWRRGWHGGARRGALAASVSLAVLLVLLPDVAAQPVAVTRPEVPAGEPLAVARLTQLEDLPLRDARGEKAGEFEDVVIELGSGRILHAVISVPRGRDEAELTVPLRELQAFRPSDERAAPRLVLLAPAATLPPASKPPAGTPYASGEGLLDDTIRDPTGAEVGEVKEVLVDFRSGVVRHLLVEPARGVASRERLYLVETARLQRPEGSAHLVLDQPAEGLAAMPAVPKNALDSTDFAKLR